MNLKTLLIAAGIGACFLPTTTEAAGRKRALFKDLYVVGDSLVDGGGFTN